MVTLHVILSVIQCAEPKQNRHCLSFHLEDIKIDYFKPPPSSDVTKNKDTFYVEL